MPLPISYLMYPKVFSDFAARQEEYGPVSSLPTPQFFYGMKPGTEIAVTIETGKTLVVRCLAIGETDDEGNVKVFFELNGQPRTAKVADRMAKSGANKHPKAEVGNPLHVAAPMPGMVSSLIVEVGQQIEAGDVLLTIEAMKMETAIHAEADGVVKKIITPVGTQIDAKDLMIELEV